MTDQHEHQDGTDLAVYQGEDGAWHARPTDEFFGWVISEVGGREVSRVRRFAPVEVTE